MTGTLPSPARRQAERIDFGRRVVRRRWGRRWLRIDLRALTVCGAIAAACLLVALLALASGDFELTTAQIFSAVTGGDDFARMVVVEWRLPRVLAALAFGAALGVSGAIFQSLTANPLASPDIIGFSTGAHTGALVVMILLGGSYLQVAGGALVGGVLTAAVVYVLAFKRGVQGFRLIIVGIAVSATLTSLNAWLMLTADLDVALAAATWGAGSLNDVTWQQAGRGSVAIVVLLVGTALLARPLHQLELGDDAAQALGVRVEPTRLALVLVGVALTATVTAAAGPIVFVALAAPQIARRLTRTAGIGLIPAAWMGALLLAVSDYTAQHLLPTALPVGVVTIVVGGAYLIWLLVHENRTRP